MYQGRLFTFGCSFTQYNWATWADLLGREFESYVNYGRSGGGNLFISSTIAEAVIRENITKNDTVMVMWTNVTREDRYIHDWVLPGNIFTQETYPEEFVKKFITVRGCYVKDMAQIYLIDKLLENIGCKYEFMSMVDMENYSQYNLKNSNNVAQDIFDLYKSTLNKFKPSVHKVLFNCNWDSRPILDNLRLDSHPLPLEHIEYINKVLPEYKFSDETLEFAKKHDIEVRISFNYNYKKYKRSVGYAHNLTPWQSTRPLVKF